MSSLFHSTKNTRAVIPDSFRFIRSDVPDHLSDEEVCWLLEHNVTTIIDLREESEQQHRACCLMNDDRFCYRTLSVTGGNTVPESPDQVSDAYIRMADSQMDIILNTIFEAQSNVLYFCNAGKDRTGVVSAILLSELGMCREYIVEDYLKSGDNLKEMLESYAQSNPDVEIRVITPQAEYMERFLDWFNKN